MIRLVRRSRGAADLSYSIILSAYVLHPAQSTHPRHRDRQGEGLCHCVIDYGQEHNLIWVTALNDSGEIWCAPNPKVRMQGNWTMGRMQTPPAEGAACG